MTPGDVLRKGSGTLCESLLQVGHEARLKRRFEMRIRIYIEVEFQALNIGKLNQQSPSFSSMLDPLDPSFGSALEIIYLHVAGSSISRRNRMSEQIQGRSYENV
jgi:hypothetical protein